MATLWNEPALDEIDAAELPVDGAIPPELDGRYLRNGGNRLPGLPAGHEFAAQGMIHGIRFGGGRAQWYGNCWVKTPFLDGAQAPPVQVGFQGGQ